jgi:hypothetical protein
MRLRVLLPSLSLLLVFCQAAPVTLTADQAKNHVGENATAPTSAAGQQSSTLVTTLNDANYVFNRYEELSSDAACDELNVSNLHQRCLDIIETNEAPLSRGKAALSRAIRAKEPRLIDLFDVYTEVNSLASTLKFLSDTFKNSSKDESRSRALANASIRAVLAGASLEMQVRERVVGVCP